MKKFTHFKYLKCLSIFFIILTCNYFSCKDEETVTQKDVEGQENLTTHSQNSKNSKQVNLDKVTTLSDYKNALNDAQTIDDLKKILTHAKKK